MRNDDIYRFEVLNALENDRELDFKKSTDAKYFREGVCPSCGKKTAYIATAKPFQIACNRLDKCGFTQSTRERYSYLFENLSERFPRTPDNSNATADAYLQRNRGFDITKLQGWYTQARRKLKHEQYADTVRFTLCDGYWERIIDAKAVAANEGDKAGIKYGMSYKGKGWMPPNQVINRTDRVYIVEGIFHAIALHLAGYKVVASISANNFPWEVVEAHRGMLVTWALALDDDKAGRGMMTKYRSRLREMRELTVVALAGERDWDDVYRDGELNDAFMEEACYQGQLFSARNTDKLAYLLYLRRPSPFFLMDFGSQLYSAQVNQAELTKDLGDEKVDGNREIFSKHTKIKRVTERYRTCPAPLSPTGNALPPAALRSTAGTSTPRICATSPSNTARPTTPR